jgi:tetratricopeptide (TPR) repeat protein
MARRFLAVFSIFFLLPLVPAPALDMDSEGYGNTADYLDGVFGVDEHAGLTTFPVLNIPMGGRSEGMAGSFGAVSDDVSFIEYNPAGSSMLPRSELAFFHNNWIADTKIEAIAFASRYKNFGYAAAGKWLYTPFTEYNLFGDRVSKGYYTEAVAILNGSYNFFSGYYFSGVSIGGSLKGAFRFMPDYSDDNNNIISGSGLSQSAFMAMADVGALTRFDFLKFYTARERNTSAALIIRNLGPAVMDEALPTSISAALSYKPLRPLMVSFDFFLPVNMLEPEASEKPYWSMGLSAAVTSFLSMRAGLLAKSGNVRLAVGSAVSLKKISFDVNYTLDLLTQLQPLNRVSVGVRIDLGDQGRLELSNRVDDLYLSGLDAYSQGDYAQAEHDWKEALKLNPKFEPAKEGLYIITRARSVEQRINDLQRLDF